MCINISGIRAKIKSKTIKQMIRTEVIIAVNDVEKSSKWY